MGLLSSMWSRSEPAPVPWADSAPDLTAGDLRAAIQTFGQQASTIGRESAEARGLLDDTTQASARGALAVAALSSQVKEITGAQNSIGTASTAGLGAVERVRVAVENVGREVGGIVATLRDVAQAAQSITQIALQTRLVAFNASVEAKRAGDAGRGFGVVADAVKDLAGKVESSSIEIMRTVSLLDKRIDALAREIRVDADESKRGEFHKALGDVQGAVASIISAAEQSRAICGGLDSQMASIATEMGQTGRSLGAAMKRSETLLDVSEHLIELVAQCDVETEDTPYINAAIDAAGQLSALLEEVLQRGSLSRHRSI